MNCFFDWYLYSTKHIYLFFQRHIMAISTKALLKKYEDIIKEEVNVKHIEELDDWLKITKIFKPIGSEYINQIFIIGWASIYRQFLPMANFIHLTEIKKAYEWDTSFPEFENEFTEVSREVTDEMDFVVYKKN